MAMMSKLIAAVAALTLTGCASAFYPPIYHAPPTYAPPVYAPPTYAPETVTPPAEPSFAIPPGSTAPGSTTPGTPAKMCDMQGTCYPAQVYHGDPTHPDRVTGPPPPITNHPPVIIPPSSDDGALQWPPKTAMSLAEYLKRTAKNDINKTLASEGNRIMNDVTEHILRQTQAEQRSARECDEVLHKDFNLLRDRMAEVEVQVGDLGKSVDDGFGQIGDRLDEVTKLLKDQSAPWPFRRGSWCPYRRRDDGQAIVGNVNAPAEGVGARKKPEDQPHAQLTYAPGVEMLRHVEAEREKVPVAGCEGL
jgi:hypothetical protein